MAGPLEIVRRWQRSLVAQDFAHMGEVVDLAGYTEICLGLTNWTTGYDVALKNYVKNMVEPWSDLKMTEQEVVEGRDAVVIHSRIEATHTGRFLGIAPTGRHVAFDHLTVIHVKDGRVVGQWAQPDLWGLYQQLTAAVPTST